MAIDNGIEFFDARFSPRQIIRDLQTVTNEMIWPYSVQLRVTCTRSRIHFQEMRTNETNRSTEVGQTESDGEFVSLYSQSGSLE